jgi:hypothetical protein
MRRLAAATAALALALALPAAAQTVTLVHKIPVGQVHAVEESSLLDAELDVQLPDGLGGRTKGKWRLFEQKIRVYTQKIVEATAEGTRTLELNFDQAVKETLQPPKKDKTRVNATLHRRRVWVGFLNDSIVRIEPTPPDSLSQGGALAAPVAPGALAPPPIADDDKGDILFAEKLYSTFPKGEVKPGQVWVLEPDVVGRAIFSFAYNPAQHAVEGKCQYKGTASLDGRKCARIAMQLKGSGQIGDLTQALHIETAPEGFLLVALDDGCILAYDLTGPVKISAGQALTQIVASGPGRSTMHYKAKQKEKGTENPAEEKKDGAAK